MEFDRKFSIGNVWTIGVVLVGLVAGWVQFGSDIQAGAKDTAALTARVTNLENNFHSLLKQLGDERVTQTRILTEIQSDLKYLKER